MITLDHIILGLEDELEVFENAVSKLVNKFSKELLNIRPLPLGVNISKQNRVLPKEMF